MPACQRLLSTSLTAVALLITAAALAAPQQVPLDPARPQAEALVSTITAHHGQGLALRLDIGQVQREEVTRAGRDWTALSLADGAHEGEPGAPELPVWTTLLAVPEGATLSVRGEGTDEVTLTDLDLAPRLRPDGGLEASELRAAKAARPLVSLGEPARMAGVTVVPLLVRPVTCDQASRTVRIAGRVDVELTWTGGQEPSRTLPPSATALLADAVLNWPEAASRLADPEGTPGTWVAVLNSPAYAGYIQPLVDWRRQQGYNVVVTDLETTGPTAQQVKAYLEQLYATVDPPLEFVTLVGDGNGSISVPTFRENLSGWNGEGDHPYSLLDGGDQLPDVHVGRLSVLTTGQLNDIVTKIIDYETAPPMGDPDWFTRGLAVGDPIDSGITTVFAARWLAEQLYDVGFERVDQIFGGDFVTSMMTSLNAGRSVFGYRGFYGVSGFTVGHASVLSNGGRLCFALFPTCDSSSWLSDATARSEALLRNRAGGAIGAIGTATIGTHTRYNNCLFYGTMEGLINTAEHRQGAALSRGKVELYRNYIVNEPDVVEIWSTWNTLMGDPATDIWLAEPTLLTVDHPAALPSGATAIPVTVTADGAPVPGALVAAVAGTSWREVARTDDDGRVLLPLPASLFGSLTLTVSGHNLLPYQASLPLGDQPHWVALDDLATADGNPLYPGATVTLDATLRSLGQDPVSGLVLQVTSESSWLEVLSADADLGDLPAGGAAQATVTVAVSPLAPDAVDAGLRFTVTGDQGSWDSRGDLAVAAPELVAAGLDFSAQPLQPGDATELVVSLTNQGSLPLAGGTAVLRSRSIWVAITDSLANLGAIPAGGTAGHPGDPFGLTFAADMVAGASVPLSIVVEQADGLRRRVDVNVTVGSRTETDPAGGDAYGYYAFDDGDVGYAEARSFAWVEIDPSRGGPGTAVGLVDTYYERDDTETVPLPFPFTYYGEEFGQLSICSNGWVAFGETNHTFWRNWTIPSAGSADGMVAVFWDDLVQFGDNSVYHWYDEAEHRYIVQWSRMRNATNGQQTCQVILLDPEHHPTRSGDGIIVCQYLEFNDNDWHRGYATLGIQSPDGTDGVCYSYYGVRAEGAAPLTSGMAITYLPRGRREARTCDLEPLSFAVSLPAGGSADHILHVTNDGEPGDPLQFTVVPLDPSVVDLAAKNMLGSSAEIDQASYTPGTPLTLDLTLYNGSEDDEWIAGFTVDLPAGVTLLDGSDLQGTDDHVLFWQGNTGDGVPAVWLGESFNMIHPGHTATGTFSIVADYGVGDLVLPWTLQGDGYGDIPHEVTGTFALEATGNLLNILTPNGGEAWSLGQVRTIAWDVSEDITAIDIELSRDGGATWESLADGYPAAAGSLDWLVAGEVTPDALVRLTSVDNALVTDTSSTPFIIQHDLSWLVVTPSSAEVTAGTTYEVTLSFSAAGLALGDHEQVLRIDHNAGGASALVPITLTVGDATSMPDVPLATGLAQNAPNPFNPATTISFSLAQRGPVDLAVFDLAGRRVALLVSGEQAAGQHTVLWDGRGQGGLALPSGTYVYRLVTSTVSTSRKLTLLK